VSGQSAEPTESVDHRSALPRFQGLLPPSLPGLPSGLPWWGATLLAVTATAVGFAYDAGTGNKELGAVFATFYVLGCLAAVVLVRRGGLFTAVTQPPLILFVAVPTAYFLFHGGQLGGLKDIAINCGYPLIERFPLMFFTSASVLLVGMARWYLDRGTPPAAVDAADLPAETPRRAARRFARSAAPVDEDEPVRAPRRPRREAADPYEPPRRTPRTGEPSRARHNRPPESDIAASAAAADRRERAAARERSGRPRRQGEPPLPGERQPRRPRNPSAREPRDPRRTPPPSRGYDPYDPRDAADYERPRRRPRPDGYEPGYGRPDDRQDPYPERPRRSSPTDSSHHPVSRVRYRSSSDEERHTEHRTRPRAGHRRDDDY
jgi:hypothetical protein